MKTYVPTEYWDTRGSNGFKYQGEWHYTVTSAPLYVARRALLLELVRPYFSSNRVQRICDYGCGDGWYIAELGRTNLAAAWWGFDLSKRMVEIASRAAPNASISVTEGGIPFDVQFDLLYCFAVLAHIKNDSDLSSVFSDIRRHLDDGGYLLLFEQTGPERLEGDMWVRRPASIYRTIAESNGFETVSQLTLSFPLFQRYERSVLRVIRRMFPGSTPVERCIKCNRSDTINKLSEWILGLEGSRLIGPNEVEQIGNTLFAFRPRQNRNAEPKDQ